MKIEEIIKSTKAIVPAKKAVLNVFYTQNVLSEKFSEVLKPYELSSEQYNVLRILRGQNNKPANMGLIQERMLAKTSNTTRLVDKLLLKQLVTREICPQNRRKMEISITQKGMDLLTEVDPKVDHHEQLFAKNLSENELNQLNELLEKFRTV